MLSTLFKFNAYMYVNSWYSALRLVSELLYHTMDSRQTEGEGIGDREEGRNGGRKEGEKIRNRGEGKEKGEGPFPETPNFVSNVRRWVCNCSPVCVCCV